MHPVEALHGDLGMLAAGDVVIALSASGETEEMLKLLATIKRLRLPLIAVTCDPLTPSAKNSSTLAAAADVALSCAVSQEACTLGLAPTASTTSMLALGDALAIALAEKKGFKEEDFANLHPGGKIVLALAGHFPWSIAGAQHFHRQIGNADQTSGSSAPALVK